MALVVGTDSYITIEEAEQYLASYYTSADVKKVAWEELEEADKEIYLRLAFRCIENLPLHGCKYLSTQTTQFPRCDSTTLEVPQAVKDAQAELAIAQLQVATGVGLSGDALDRRDLQAQGVTKIKIGKLEETYDLSRTTANENVSLSLSEAAKTYLGPWLRGGYNVQGLVKTNSFV